MFSIDVRLKDGGRSGPRSKRRSTEVLREFIAGRPDAEAELARAKATSYGDMVRADGVDLRQGHGACPTGAMFSDNPGHSTSRTTRTFGSLTGNEVTAASGPLVGKPSYRLAVPPTASMP